MQAAFPPSEYYGLAAPENDIGEAPAYPCLIKEAISGSGVAHVAIFPRT